MECNTILERVERRAKEKCTRDVLGDTAIGAGESATRSRSVGFNKSTQRAIHRKTRCKETFVNVRTQRRKGKVTTSPKVKVKARARENIQERETATRTQAGSPDEETGQRTLGDFVIKHKRVELVGDVQENDDFESHRLDRAAYVFCGQKCNSVSNGSDGTAEFVEESL